MGREELKLAIIEIHAGLPYMGTRTWTYTVMLTCNREAIPFHETACTKKQFLKFMVHLIALQASEEFSGYITVKVPAGCPSKFFHLLARRGKSRFPELRIAVEDY